VGPRAGLDGYELSRPTGIRSSDRPDPSKSLYRPSCRGLEFTEYQGKNLEKTLTISSQVVTARIAGFNTKRLCRFTMHFNLSLPFLLLTDFTSP